MSLDVVVVGLNMGQAVAPILFDQYGDFLDITLVDRDLYAVQRTKALLESEGNTLNHSRIHYVTLDGTDADEVLRALAGKANIFVDLVPGHKEKMASVAGNTPYLNICEEGDEVRKLADSISDGQIRVQGMGFDPGVFEILVRSLVTELQNSDSSVQVDVEAQVAAIPRIDIKDKHHGLTYSADGTANMHAFGGYGLREGELITLASGSGFVDEISLGGLNLEASVTYSTQELPLLLKALNVRNYTLKTLRHRGFKDWLIYHTSSETFVSSEGKKRFLKNLFDRELAPTQDNLGIIYLKVSKANDPGERIEKLFIVQPDRYSGVLLSGTQITTILPLCEAIDKIQNRVYGPGNHLPTSVNPQEFLTGRFASQLQKYVAS